MIFSNINTFSQEWELIRIDAEYNLQQKPEEPVLNRLAAGTYTVGVEGYFPSLDSAFSKLSIDGIEGEVVLELVDEFYSPNSNGFTFVGPIIGASRDNRIVIKPAKNKNVVISGDGDAVITFMNISYLMIDGISLAGTSSLKIHSLQNENFDYNDGIIFINNSDHNIVQNLTVECEDYTRKSAGIIFLHHSGNSTPDSNVIQNNFIKKAAVGINVASLFYRMNGNIIRGNYIGSETDSLISLGINVTFGQYTIIENNTVQNLHNRSEVSYSPGIASVAGTGDTIRNNIVHNISVDDGYYGGVGIILNGTSSFKGCINTVYNNMIYDIQSTSSATSASVSGIQLRNQDFAKIYHNSVFLIGTGNNKFGSASLFIANSCSNIIAKNNILINTRDESPYYAYALNDCVSGSMLSDYNDLYVGENQNSFLAEKNGNLYKTLSEWQSIGMDNHSLNFLIIFTNPDLHIDRRQDVCIEMTGTPISGITTDIDGEQRNLQTPDIGADEFDCIVSEVAKEFISDEYCLEQNYPNPFNPSTKISYSLSTGGNVTLKVFDILGNEIAVLVNEGKSAGKYEINFNASNLSSGVYIYTIQIANYYESRKMLLIK
jgi:hypothetical protein